jgi:signal peptidase I
MIIKLNCRNFLLYGRTINRLEKIKLEERDGLYYLNGEPATQYIFRNNYYFMLGDNRHYSNDSRYWGLVPEENVVGKTGLILFNCRDGKFRWDRLLMQIE